MTFLLNSEELSVVTLTVQSSPASIVLHFLISRFRNFNAWQRPVFFQFNQQNCVNLRITAKVFLSHV